MGWAVGADRQGGGAEGKAGARDRGTNPHGKGTKYFADPRTTKLVFK